MIKGRVVQPGADRGGFLFADCAWVVEGKTEWSVQRKVNVINGYQVYADQARALGIDPGGLWNSFKDWPHVQMRGASSPLKVFSLTEIDKVMKERFGV
jgi:peptidoglycan L-alanyl-D-glutamate endopeptidase CwlK